MKELKLETRVEVYAVGELDNIYRQLYEAAFEASKKAYAPYSKFHVIRCALGLADIRHLAEHRAGRVAHVVRAQIEVRVKVDDAELRRLAVVL